MKKIIITLIVSFLALRGYSQEVINAKGTKVYIDSSKWTISGPHIYNKNPGNVGIGVSAPTAQLHTTGTVRFAGVGVNVTNTKILTTDADGNVTTRLFSSLLSGNALTSMNGLTGSSQSFATGTSGTSFNIVSSGDTHTFNLPNASATTSGALSASDWNSFNSRIDTVQATTAAAVTTNSQTSTINNTGAYWNANQLQGRAIASTAPTTGQLLNWNGTAWTPTTTTHTLSSSTNTITSVVNGVSVTANAVNSVSNTSSANNLRTTVNGVAGSNVTIINTNALTQNGTNQLVSTVNGVGATALTVNATGDVTGNLGATVVSKINGSPLGTTTGATSGQVLSWNGTAWAPASAAPATTTHTLSNTTNTITSVVNGVSVTAPAVNTVSNTSTANTLTTSVNGVAAGSVNLVNSNTLTQNGSNQLVSTVNGVAADALTVSATGDVTGNLGATTVTKINGSPLGTTTGASNGQVLTWNGTAWVPAAASASITGVSNSSTANTLTTTVNGTTGSAVNIINSNTLTQNGTNQLVSTVNGISADALTVNTGGDVTGSLGSTTVSKINGSPLGTTTGASNGQVLTWNGTAWAPAAVPAGSTTHTIGSSVNTITSVVNGVSDTALAVNSNALSLNGSNQLISTVNGVASSALTVTSGGDVTGNLGATTVAKINGSPLGTTTGATTGQALIWNGTAWAPATVSQNAGAARLSSNFTTSSTSAKSTNLTFAIGANESYFVTIEGSASKATSSTGMKIGIAAPTGCTISGEVFTANSASTALVPSFITAINTLGNTFATSTGTQVAFKMTFVVVNSSTAGNITLQAATVTSNTATIYAGTRMSWVKATGL